jgi:hypothetical protein
MRHHTAIAVMASIAMTVAGCGSEPPAEAGEGTTAAALPPVPTLPIGGEGNSEADDYWSSDRLDALDGAKAQFTPPPEPPAGSGEGSGTDPGAGGGLSEPTRDEPSARAASFGGESEQAWHSTPSHETAPPPPEPRATRAPSAEQTSAPSGSSRPVESADPPRARDRTDDRGSSGERTSERDRDEAPAETYRIRGTVDVPDHVWNEGSGEARAEKGDACRYEREGYEDVRDGGQVTIRNGDGSIIALGELHRPRLAVAEGEQAGAMACRYSFTIGDVPRSKYYTVELGMRQPMHFAHDTLAGSDWRVALGLYW